jgi:catechol 2,3-dioxygenase-like lactoylglutathione lyase family enzyme
MAGGRPSGGERASDAVNGGPPSGLGRVLETSVYVSDLARAEVFYAGVLGLEVFAREEGRHVYFRVGDSMLLAFRADRTKEGHHVPAHGTAGSGHFALAAPAASIAAWRDYLRARGVAIEQEGAWRGGLRSLYFRDPDGNSVEIAPAGIWGLAEGR